MLQPEKFICIEYPQVDFLIPSDYVVSSVGVKDLDISLLHDQSSGIFDFDEIAAGFEQYPRKSDIKTMIVLKSDDNSHMSVVTTQECRVCTIKLKEFGLFSDFYTEQFQRFGILACSFKDNKIQMLMNVKETIDYMMNSQLEEL